MTRLPRFPLDFLALITLFACFAPAAAKATNAAGGPAESAWRSPFACERAFANGKEWARSDANLDLYNGLALFGLGGGLALGGQPSRRWTAVNSLDDGVRDGLRFDSAGARKKASLASDVLVGASALIPLASIGAHQSRTRDCVESWDMMTDFIESLGLTLAITQSVKLAAGRARPVAQECDGSPPSDAHCNSQERFLSFFSGHASLAATGAGLTCAFAYKRHAWGSSAAAKATPCGLGIAAALAAGTLRVAADRHWITDVAVGFLVGGVVGYFDTWGPFDLLRFERRNEKGGPPVRGMLLPSQVDGRPGARFVMSF